MTFLNNLTNMFGNIDINIKKRLINYYNNPTIENWDDVYCIIIDANGTIKTVWNAWIEIDNTAPLTGRATDIDNNIIKEWSKIPDSFTFLRALKYISDSTTQ